MTNAATFRFVMETPTPLVSDTTTVVRTFILRQLHLHYCENELHYDKGIRNFLRLSANM